MARPGIYAKTQYGDILANVDWLHGGAESLLTITNLWIVFGLRSAMPALPRKPDSPVPAFGNPFRKVRGTRSAPEPRGKGLCCMRFRGAWRVG